jgi:hypothetical protein
MDEAADKVQTTFILLDYITIVGASAHALRIDEEEQAGAARRALFRSELTLVRTGVSAYGASWLLTAEGRHGSPVAAGGPHTVHNGLPGWWLQPRWLQLERQRLIKQLSTQPCQGELIRSSQGFHLPILFIVDVRAD